MPEFWISRVTKGTCAAMQLWKGSEYSRILIMPGFYICKCYTLNLPEYGIWLRIIPVETVLTMAGFWIYVFKVSQGFEHTSVSKHARAQNMASLWIWEGCSGCWIYLNKPEYALMMLQYMLWQCWIYLNILAYIWINKVLYIPEFWISLMQYIA